MSRTTRLVYIAHPLGAGPERAENLKRAARWCVWAWFSGGYPHRQIGRGDESRATVIPVAPWIAIATILPETDDARERGLRLDKQTIARCDEVWLVGGRVSPGMAIERDHAIACGVEVLGLTHLGDEPPA